MYTCKVLVKHGVVLVGRPSSRGSRRDNLLATTASETSTSSASTAPPLFSVRALAKSFPKFQAAPYGSQMPRRDRAYGTAFARSQSAANESSVSVSDAEEERASKFDVSSNCVTPVFRVSPFVQNVSVILPDSVL